MNCSPMSSVSVLTTIPDGCGSEKSQKLDQNLTISLKIQLQFCWCHGLGKDTNRRPCLSSRFTDKYYLSGYNLRPTCSSMSGSHEPDIMLMDDKT
ncbi:hypothetical protein TNCV_3193311 [Trichonephila clavipes]|nr:hypothetical protein TNCV_3193311 [Trichonephila clavipes]